MSSHKNCRESTLYLEDQKGNINLAYLDQDSNDDNNSIDDNAVDSQDSAIDEDHQVCTLFHSVQ